MQFQTPMLWSGEKKKPIRNRKNIFLAYLNTKVLGETTSLPFDPLWSTPGPWQQTARGRWPRGLPSLWSVLSAAGRTLHERSRGSWSGWRRCGCRWTAACRWVRAGSAKTGGEGWESGGRLEVKTGERRQTLGSSDGDVKRWTVEALIEFCRNRWRWISADELSAVGMIDPRVS